MTTRHACLLVRATWLTYRYRSTFYFAERKRLIFVVAFLLAPLASIPELVVSPVMIIVDADAALRLRGGAFALLSSIWTIWIAATRSFVATAHDFTILRGAMPFGMRTFHAALWLAAMGWPLAPLSILIALAATGDVTCRALGALTLSALAGIAASSAGRYVHGWYGRWGYDGRSRLVVFSRSALTDVFPAGRPALLVRYLAGLGCVVFAVQASPAPSPDVTILLCVVSGTLLWIMRDAVANLLRETLQLAPILSTTRFLPCLCVARLIAMSAMFSLILAAVATSMPGSLWAVAVILTIVACGTAMLVGFRVMRLADSWDWVAICSPVIIATLRYACQS